MYKELILGSPGTGKTTKLLQIIDDKLETIAPEKIAFVSFTKKAVSEATDRAATKFNLAPYRLRNFKTLHSICYRELRVNRNKVCTPYHLKQLEKITGLKLTAKNPEEDVIEKGDTFLFFESKARSIKKDVRTVWENEIHEYDWFEFKWFVDTYNAFKQQFELIDFTDMLQKYLDCCAPVDLDVLFVDEAQDLNPLQWDVVNHLMQKAKEVYIAGDDDQAVYKWSGADVNYFLNLDINKKIVLPISYRLPKEIFNFSNNIVEKIKHRYDKDWQPQDRNGTIEYHNDISAIDFEGNWFILARSNYQLRALESDLKARGYFYTIKGKSSVQEEHLLMIHTYLKLQHGKPVDKGTEDLVKKFFNKETPWFEALYNISFKDREYYRELLRQGIKLNSDPQIHLSTFHASKGGEADNVLIITDLAKQVYDNYMLSPDDEHRVFYVGATRAKKALHILTPQTELAYIF